jgi:hypothetical protein
MSKITEELYKGFRIVLDNDTSSYKRYRYNLFKDKNWCSSSSSDETLKQEVNKILLSEKDLTPDQWWEAVKLIESGDTEILLKYNI